MPKKTTILMVALILLVTVPASAQRDAGERQEEPASETVAVTGVIEKPEITSYMYGTHAITDEASGALYALKSEEEGLLDDYVGQRVTVFGTLVPGYEDGAIEGGPPLVEVAQVEPAANDNTTGGQDLNGDGMVDQADGEFAAAVSDAAMSAADESDSPVLPATGGPALPLGAVLLLIAGLLLRPATEFRLSRVATGLYRPPPRAARGTGRTRAGSSPPTR